MSVQWFNIIGLFLNFVGSIVLVYGLIINKKTAIELGIFRWAARADKDNLKQPQIKDRLMQSRNAIIGCCLLAIGFALQIIANFPSG